ncbi:MAG: hypothetical protein ACFB20_02655 [Opitutales bacterium]
MRPFSPENYLEPLRPLLRRNTPAPLGPGQPETSMGERIKAAEVVRTLQAAGAKDADMAEACLAGIYLLHDHLDTSHTLSQSISGPTGSFWHGIMHRREPDYPNGKYWFARVGEHPIYDDLQSEACRLSEENPGTVKGLFICNQDHWNPDAFIDFVEAVSGQGGPDEALALAIQQREWELLFDYSYQSTMAAVGG